MDSMCTERGESPGQHAQSAACSEVGSSCPCSEVGSSCHELWNKRHGSESKKAVDESSDVGLLKSISTVWAEFLFSHVLCDTAQASFALEFFLQWAALGML
eukprot:5771935-Amphidinium_carterae.1